MHEIIMHFITFLLAANLTGPSAQPTEVCYSSCRELQRATRNAESYGRIFCITGQAIQAIQYHGYNLEIIIRDKTGTTKVTGRTTPDIHTGDRLIISGKIKKDREPFPFFTNIVKVGHSDTPDPVSASVRDILSGRFDWRLVSVRGMLLNSRPSELAPEWVIMTLNCDGIPLLASSPLRADLLHKLDVLTGATVDLICVVIPNDGSRRTKIGRILHFDDIGAVRVVRPPPKDPFDVPDIRTIYDQAPFIISTLGRHSAQGRIIARWDGNMALLRLEDGSVVKVKFSEQLTFDTGSFIQVVGLPESDLQHINLIAAIARPACPFPFRDIPAIDGLRLLSKANMSPVADMHGRTIHISGTVRAVPSPMSPSKMFYLEVNEQLVSVNVSSTPGILARLQTNSKIELTGICVMSIENWRPRLALPQIDGCFIVPRTPKDITILSQPSWWTPQRLAVLIAVLIVILFAILIWNSALRKLATRKSRELFHEQLGHVKAELRTEERTRLAVELHDTLAQNLTGVSLEIDTATKIADESPSLMKVHLDTAARALKSCRDELRNCLWDLRNRALETATMDEAIRQTLAPHMVEGVDVAIRFSVPRERISDNTAHAILRIARELTLNAIRHGKATKIWIAGSIDGDQMLFSVRDNGCGFEPNKAPGFAEGHYGLLGIRERIDEFEGEFTLKSSRGNGTKATMSLKMPQETRS